MPLVKRIHQDKAKRGLEIVAITRDPVPRAAALRSGLQIPYAVASDPRGQVLRDYMINPIPAFVLVDARGVVRALAVGSGWPQQLALLLPLADKLLRQAAPPPLGARPLPAPPSPRGSGRPVPRRPAPARSVPETF